jgi:hypothetical protein
MVHTHTEWAGPADPHVLFQTCVVAIEIRPKDASDKENNKKKSEQMIKNKQKIRTATKEENQQLYGRSCGSPSGP